MKIAIVGAGALGLYYGIRLGLGGEDVAFFMRSDLATVRGRGAVLLHQGGKTEELRPVRAAESAAEIGKVELVVVTTKTTVNEAVAEALPPLLGPETAILTLQNGLGADEFFARRFGAARVLGGLAFIANNRTAPGEVTCYHPGSLTLGEFDPAQAPAGRLRAIADLFQKSGVKARLAENLASARWHKLIWNIPFNGLTIAGGRVATDRICGDPALAEEARALMREVQGAAARLGFPISDDFLRQQFDVTPPMGAYRPSTLVDYEAGREIEVEPIWGEPLRRARAAGAACPRLTLLYAMLRVLNAARTGV